MPEDNDPEAIISPHQPLFTWIYEALEAALASTLEFFRKEHGAKHLVPSDLSRIDRYLLTAMVRYYVLQHMEGHNIDAKDPDDIETNDKEPAVNGSTGYKLKTLINNGIRIVYGDVVFWLLKKHPGHVLPTSVSPAHDFQQATLFGANHPKELIVLWSTDARYTAVSLEVICPKGPVDTVNRYEWRQRVPHPADVPRAGDGKQLLTPDLPVEIRRLGKKDGKK